MLTELPHDNSPSRPRTLGHRERWMAFAAMAALIWLSGCGEKWADCFPVSGVLKYNGQPPQGAQLVFHPINPSGSDAISPKATVKQDGSFIVTSYASGDGAPPGEYVVTIEWYQIDNEGNVGPNVIPKPFSDPRSSPLRATVNSGGPTTLDPIFVTANPAPGAAPVRR